MCAMSARACGNVTQASKLVGDGRMLANQLYDDASGT
jgi:hypothetical protein